MYTADIMKTRFGIDPIDIIHQNFIVSIVQLVQVYTVIYLAVHFHPMRILNWFRYFGFIIILSLPYLLNMANSPRDILYVQIFCVIFAPDCTPSQGFLCSHMPVLRRFTSMSVLYALSRAVMYSIVTFGMVLFTAKFGNHGLWFIGLPLCTGYAWGVHHFRKLAKIEQKNTVGTILPNLVVDS